MNNRYDPDEHGELLSAYLDDALDDKQKAFVEGLLLASESARQDLEGLVAVQQAFRQWKPTKPDVFFSSRVEARILEEEAKMVKVLPWHMRLHSFAVAAMVLLTLGGVALLSHLRDTEDFSTAEAFWEGNLDQDVAQIAVLNESDVSKEMVLDFILAENVR